MTDFGEIILAGATLTEFYQTYRKVIATLPWEMKRQLNEINLHYFAAYGSVGVYERMNSRTINQIFAEYQRGDGS